jgi:riboflavin kinase
MDYASAALLEAPMLLRGPVIKGFGRGSKELGIPTANLDAEALGAAVAACAPGVYYGWASVGAAPEVHKMVMSIGWCVGAARTAAGAHALPSSL